MARIFASLMFMTSVALAAPADDLVAQGNAAMQKMDVVAAMGAFDAALKADPVHAEAAYQRGRILLKIGEPSKAIADFTTAVISKPDMGRSFARRGEAKIVLKDWVGAFKDFDEAVRVSPQEHEMFVIRATYRWKRGELGGALADMKSAIAVADKATAAQLRIMLDKMK